MELVELVELVELPKAEHFKYTRLKAGGYPSRAV